GARTRKLTAEISREKNAPPYGCTRQNGLRTLSRNVFDKRASTCTIGHFFCLELSRNNAKREKTSAPPGDHSGRQRASSHLSGELLQDCSRPAPPIRALHRRALSPRW